MFYKHILLTLLCSLLFYSCQSAKSGDKVVITAHISPTASGEQREAVKNILNGRLTQLGAQDIQLDETDSLLIITMYSEVRTAIIRPLIEKTGQVQILETYDNTELFPLLNQVDQLMAESEIFSNDYNAEVDSNYRLFPLLSILVPNLKSDKTPIATACIGFVKATDTVFINQVLSMPSVLALLPNDLKIAFSIKSNHQDSPWHEVIATKNPAFGSMAIDNSMIDSAKVGQDTHRHFEVNLTLKEEYHAYWKNMTESNIGRCLAIVIDGKVASYPNVQEGIEGGKASIGGSFSKGDVMILAGAASYPPLPIAVEVQSVEVFTKKK